MEYDYALERQLPVLAFLHKDPSAIPSGKTEEKDQGKEALDAFRKKIEKSRHANYWKSATELAGSVALGMLNLKNSSRLSVGFEVTKYRTRARPKRFFVCGEKLIGFRNRLTMLRRSHQKVVEDSLRVTKLFRFISVSI